MSAGHVLTSDLGKLLRETKKLRLRSGAIKNLNELSPNAIAAIPTDAPPHAQGRELARWLRRELGAGTGPVEPRAILERWGVEVRDVKLETSGLEAVSIWGPHRGPSVLLNVAAKRSQSKQGSRATLAHEIAHLLVDRAAALPFAEVLGGGAPLGPEKRANGFAAELLLPREVAVGSFEKAETAIQAREILDRLWRKFSVSREIIAWQTLKYSAPLPPVRHFLKSFIPPERRDQV